MTGYVASVRPALVGAVWVEALLVGAESGAFVHLDGGWDQKEARGDGGTTSGRHRYHQAGTVKK